jgi:hypothetical protein
MKITKTDMRVGTSLVGLVLVGLAIAPGCSSGGNSGGSPDAGGGVDATADGPGMTNEGGGGHEGGGGTDSGTNAESGPAMCSSAPPSSPTIIGSTFSVSDSGATQITWGTGTDQWNTYTYQSTGQPTPMLSATASGGLNVVASLVVPDGSGAVYAGAGVAFAASTCIDASAYSGVEFTLSGSLGGCQVAFGINFAEDTTPANDANRGKCTATNCYGPSYSITSVGTMIVPFTALSGGMPMGTVDPSQLTSIQWQFALPSAQSGDGGGGCSANFTVSDVSFVMGDAGAGGTGDGGGGMEAGGGDGGSDGSSAHDGGHDAAHD